MAEKHPYSPGGAGGITSAITQLRNSFPATVTAQTLKKLGIAPNNESYIINILRFVGVVDEKGNKTPEAGTAFSQGDTEFQKQFGAMIKAGYSELFHLHNDAAWSLDENKLISFFRTSDQTSQLTGQRQASTFRALASLAGHGAPPVPAKPKQPKEGKPAKLAKAKTEPDITPAFQPNGNGNNNQSGGVGLTVRIEVNLPPDGNQETYDKIFRSIRENLLNAK